MFDIEIVVLLCFDWIWEAHMNGDGQDTHAVRLWISHESKVEVVVKPAPYETVTAPIRFSLGSLLPLLSIALVR